MNKHPAVKWLALAAFGVMMVPAIAKAQTASTASPAQSTASAANAGTSSSTAASSQPKSWDDNNPNGAIAKCKDGTYWHSQTRNGVCSGRGGVGTWLQKPSTTPSGATKTQVQGSPTNPQ